MLFILCTGREIGNWDRTCPQCRRRRARNWGNCGNLERSGRISIQRSLDDTDIDPAQSKRKVQQRLLYDNRTEDKERSK